MRRTFILLATAVLLCIPVISSAKPKHDKEKKKITLFTSPDRKALIRERDSLRLANEALMMELDSLYREYADLEVYEELTEADSLSMDIMGTDIIGSVPDTAVISRDSLLSLWYQQRDLNLMEIEPSDIDTIEMVSDIPDSVYISRLQKLNPYISVPYNRIIRNHIVYYTQKMPEKMERILGLGAHRHGRHRIGTEYKSRLQSQGQRHVAIHVFHSQAVWPDHQFLCGREIRPYRFRSCSCQISA